MSGRKNSRKYFLVVFIAFSLVFSPLNFSLLLQTTMAEGEGVPPEEVTGSVVWSENRTVSGMVVVQSGATLTIQKGVVVEFDGQSQIDVSGNLIIAGTPEEPVVLKKKDGDADDFYTISTTSGSGKILVRNANVSGGGKVYEAFQVMRPSLLQRAYAYWFYAGAFNAWNNGALDIERVNFHDNALAVQADSQSNSRIKVWRSKFVDNGLDVVNRAGQWRGDVRYNWWGNEGGPAACTEECGGYDPRPYQKIIGQTNVADWAKSEYFKDPVIIIPGTMGSWKITQSGDLKLDPIFGTYDELVETLDESGYTPDTDLFLFPYEWRASNVATAKALQTRINQIKAQVKWPRVDIVAHSMGGLVAREYIGTLNGGGSVDQLITLGTPHDGSPKGYLTWEGGEFGVKFRDALLEKIFQQEAEENGYDGVFQYIRQAPVASVRELLPTYSYLRNRDTDDVRAYPELYPKNTFLENLKTTTNINRLSPVLFTNIVGKTETDSTIEKVRVDGPSIELLNDSEVVVLWGHGKPDGYDDLLGGDRGLELGAGDGTVPIDSAKSILADETIELESEHSKLPSDAAKVVFSKLNGYPALTDVPALIMPTSLLLFMPFSPVDIQVVSPSDKKVGKNFETDGYYDEIDGAYYTGFDTENEFITIPNPEKGEYRVLTQGTGAGDYRVEAAHIEEIAGGQGKESVATITGVAEIGVETESLVELKETGEVVAEGNQDTTPPVTTAAVAGTAGIGGWYTSDAVVTLAAADEENGSGVEKTEYSLDNGATWSVYSAPIFLVQEGTTTLQYRSTDQAGNQETAKSETIKIDKTAPEGKITLNPITRKLEITGTDNLGGAVSVALTELPVVFVGPRLKDHDRSHEEHRKKKRFQARLTDEAGHVTSIAFLREKQEKNELAFKVQSVTYDAVEMTVMKTAAQYEWQKNGKKPYQKLEAELRTATERLESHYMPKKNETWIRERNSEWQKLPGLVVPYLETAEGLVQGKY